jgi:hypothetical protein
VRTIYQNVSREIAVCNAQTLKCPKIVSKGQYFAHPQSGTHFANIQADVTWGIREDGGKVNFIVTETKIFAILFLVFANTLALAQSDGYRMPAGSKIRLTMDSEISSEVASVDDTFTARVTEPVLLNGVIVLPSGTIVEGRVIEVSRAASAGRAGRMRLRFERLRFAGGPAREMDGSLEKELKARSGAAVNTLAVLGGGAAGALAGMASKTANGVLVGTAIGAGAGSAVALLRKGKDVRIQTDEEFVIVLNRELSLPAVGY